MANRDSAGTEHVTDWNVRHVRIGDAVYPYYYGYRCLDLIVHELAALGADRFIVVTDDTVLNLHGDSLLSRLREVAPVDVFSHQPGESMKTLPVLVDVVERSFVAGATRRSVVIAFGGGVPGNLGGLLAALLFRGIRMVHIPTTTVAAMDSVLSLKQSINSSRGKNHIGTYAPPCAVFTDVRLLATLSERELRSGLCEAAKNCLAINPSAMPTLRRILADGELSSPASLLWLLNESIAAKTTITANDTREQRRGLVLEYGHSVGHAVELADYRQRGACGVSHGEAIAFGMVVAARIAHARGWLTTAELELHEDVVAELSVPLRLPGMVAVDDVMALLRDDNKRGYLSPTPDEVPFVLLKGLGQPAGDLDMPLVLVSRDELLAAFASLTSPEAAMATSESPAF